MVCKLCGKDVSQTVGRRSKLYCDARCKRGYFRVPREKVEVSRELYDELMLLKAKKDGVKALEVVKPVVKAELVKEVVKVTKATVLKGGDVREPREGTMAYYNKYNVSTKEEREDLESLLP